MVYVRTRKFCCCLPVRFGVFFLTLLGTFGGGLLTILEILTLVTEKKIPLDSTQRVSAEISVVIWGLLTAISLLGFVGACTKNRLLISLFSGMLIFQLVLSIATGIFAIVVLFRDNAQVIIDQCLQDERDKGNTSISESDCRTGLALIKGLTVGLYVLIWLLSLYAIIIVNNYVKQLEDEDDVRMANAGEAKTPDATLPVVVATTYNSYNTPSSNAGQYPFADKTQSFGTVMPPSRGGSYV
ncbi:hypothetical protein HGRIS_014222 [Hohenbuehelia grisea]|uniref:Tetraspanin n=1 Tax=Hohenbuehelia grisea TaxID=104357 RepID=A0ABR3JSU1_9AGAR